MHLHYTAPLRHGCNCCHTRLVAQARVRLLSRASLQPGTTQARLQLLTRASLLPSTTQARLQMLKRASTLHSTTQARVHLLSRASGHSGTGAIAVTHVYTTRHHLGTRAFAVMRVSTTRHHSGTRAFAVICGCSPVACASNGSSPSQADAPSNTAVRSQLDSSQIEPELRAVLPVAALQLHEPRAPVTDHPPSLHRHACAGDGSISS